MRSWGSDLRSVLLRSVLFASVLTGPAVSVSLAEEQFAAAQAPAPRAEMRPPQIATAKVDWSAALGSLTDVADLRTVIPSTHARPPRIGSGRPVPHALRRLNAAMAHRFAGVARSPVPVLLPFDTGALLRDLAEGTATDSNERYLSGFQPSKFFYPGPSGYDAVFSLRAADVPEFSDIKYAEPIDVLISGSVLLYDLDDPTPPSPAAATGLEDEYPGIQRLIHEHHLRYTFVRFGVPYVVSAACFDASVSRYKMPPCRAADRVLQRFLRSLKVAGGTPKPTRMVQPMAIERPAVKSPDFTYHPPGRLLPSTGFRGLLGRADDTVYSQIRFPIADTPAFVNSQMFQRRNRGHENGANYAYPWRDNFCERRGFPVGQCPAGFGHQGQDIRTQACPPGLYGERCYADRNLVAVRDGAILRRPKQEAVYLFVNTANEHLRFRYLHMVPRKMDEDSLLSGRRVHEGEVIGQVGNFNKRENGTSYHLHFDIQVPTKNGWVFVNPYMTLVAAYERLIGGRGEAVSPPVTLATTEPSTTGSASPAAIAVEEAAPRKGERVKKKRKARKHVKRGKPVKPIKRKNTHLARH
jgi:hypothetical protein